MKWAKKNEKKAIKNLKVEWTPLVGVEPLTQRLISTNYWLISLINPFES